MIEQFKVGDKVTYNSGHGNRSHGIVKSIPDEDHCFVVYDCGGDWEQAFDYTAARTDKSDLLKGWVS